MAHDHLFSFLKPKGEYYGFYIRSSSLPGHKFQVANGATCDEHPDRLATVRMQGDTDSFGAEYYDMCAECTNDYEMSLQDTSGVCDWCECEVESRVATRDSEEGSTGPVYYVCRLCSIRNISDQT